MQHAHTFSFFTIFYSHTPTITLFTNHQNLKFNNNLNHSLNIYELQNGPSEGQKQVGEITGNLGSTLDMRNNGGAFASHVATVGKTQKIGGYKAVSSFLTPCTDGDSHWDL
jgi:hypothetical protein